MYTVNQIVERFSVSEHTVLRWIRVGELRAVNVARTPGGRPTWRISPEELERFEAARSSQPPAPPTKQRRKRSTGDVKEFF